MNICIAGQMRNYSSSCDSILDYFSNYSNEVFISTWDETGGKNVDSSDWNDYREDIVNLNDIREKFNTNNIIVTNRKNFLKKYSEYRDFTLTSYEDRMFSQHYKWYSSILLGIKNNPEEKVTVKARPDMIYRNYNKFDVGVLENNDILGCEGTTIESGFLKRYWTNSTPLSCYGPEFDKIKSKVEKFKDYEKVIDDFELQEFFDLIDKEKIKETILSFSYDQQDMPGICDILLISKTDHSLLYSSLLFFIHIIAGFDGFYSNGYCPIKVIFGLMNLHIKEIDRLSVHAQNRE